jgi:hypothetical protein
MTCVDISMENNLFGRRMNERERDRKSDRIERKKNNSGFQFDLCGEHFGEPNAFSLAFN